MSDRYLDNLLPDFGEYSLESFLDSYRKRSGAPVEGSPPAEAAEPAKAAEAIAQRSRQIVMEALGETLKQHQAKQRQQTVPELEFDLSGLPEPPDASSATARVKLQAPEATDKKAPFTMDEEDAAPEAAESETPAAPSQEVLTPEAALLDALGKAAQKTAQPAPDAEPKPRVHISPDGIITVDVELPQSPEQQPDEDPEGSGDEEEQSSAREEDRSRRRVSKSDQEEKPSAAERFLRPLVRYAAVRIARKQMQRAEAANWPDPVDFRETDELPPKKAMHFYAQQLRPLRFRCRVCLFLCLVLAWIGLQLPMAGLLGKSLTAQAGVSLVLLMTVMMVTLDILVAGVRQLFDLRPGREALAFLAALMSCVDAAMVMLGYGEQLPFCAVGAFSLAAGLWGEKLDCTARARSMRMAAMSKNPSAVTVQETGRGGRYLCRSARQAEGFVRRSEQPDFCQSVYATAAPIFLLVSFLLAILSSLGGQGAYFLHTLSALLCVSASFTAFLSFPLAYAMVARKLQYSGAAIMGYAGCADVGKTKRVVISDGDLFPPGTMKLSAINILEGAAVDKVIGYTTGLLQASGSGVAEVFMDLIRRRGYAIPQIEEFRCHEGGGLSARIGGEQVLVGSAGFMNLMGIRLPQNMTVKNTVCTAISGELTAVFALEYIPVSSVQEALMTLLQGRTQPIFAIRDFNITPLMIRQLFRMPTDGFNFPTYRDRYRIAAGTSAKDAPAAVILSRTGMGPLVDAAEAGRKLYSTCRVGTIISLVGTAIGLVTMFLLCRAGSYETANAGNVLSYLFLWALPVAILAYGQSR